MEEEAKKDIGLDVGSGNYGNSNMERRFRKREEREVNRPHPKLPWLIFFDCGGNCLACFDLLSVKSSPLGHCRSREIDLMKITLSSVGFGK